MRSVLLSALLLPAAAFSPSLCGQSTGNRCLDLPDKSSYVDFGAAPGITFGCDTFTVEWWTKGTGRGPLLSRRHSDPHHYPAVSNWALAIDGANHWPPNTYDAGQRDGLWHHIAWIKNGSVFTVFVDGVFIETYTDTWACSSPLALYLGRQQSWFQSNLGPGYLIGMVDEVRYWDYARSAPEILADMNRVIDSAPGLVSSWHFEDDLLDAAGSNHGTPKGNATFADGPPLDPDSDGDGLGDALEVSLGTDPMDQDTDDDGLSDGEEVLTGLQDALWVRNQLNQHWFKLLRPTTWQESEDAAVALGGHLATVRDQAEQDWLYERFGQHRIVPGSGVTWWALSPWIGLSDQRIEGVFEWSSGEIVNYVNWGPGEPNNWGGNEDHTLIVHSSQPEASDWWDAADQPHFGIVELDVAVPPSGFTDPLDPDTDRDGILDGTELGVTVGWPGDPGNSILGTDPAFFVPDADPLTTTSPIDDDHDDDGMSDGAEDLDFNGRVDAGEADPNNPDTDGDGLQDGLEAGEVDRLVGSTFDVFAPDGDPATTTDPVLADTDGGGLADGEEDFNRDGVWDFPYELDPNNPLDDTITLIVPPLVRGQFVTLVADGVRKSSKTWFCYSLKGSGPFTHPTYGFTLDLTPPIPILGSANATSAGSVGYSATVPASIPVGLSLWVQAVEGWGQPVFSFRVSNMVPTTFL